MVTETASQQLAEVDRLAEELYSEFFPSAVAFICALSENPELNAQDPRAQDQANGLLAQVAFEIYFDSLLSQTARDKDSGWLDVNPESESDRVVARFWILSGLATLPDFERMYRSEVTEAITIHGKLSLDEESDSVPQ